MELWVFDRSGPYSSGAFDIHKEPEKFARAFVGYATMDNEALGLDTFVEQMYGHDHVSVHDAGGSTKSIRLGRLIVRQNAIVCRGTTCFLTRDGGSVAKFSWVSDKRKLEVDHLRLAEEKGVQGVARVVAHRQITTIAELRKGLKFGKRHRFQNENAASDGTSPATRGASASHHLTAPPRTHPGLKDCDLAAGNRS